MTLLTRRAKGFCGAGLTRASRGTWTTTTGCNGTARLATCSSFLSCSCGLPAIFRFGWRTRSSSCANCCLWTRGRLFCTTFTSLRRCCWTGQARCLSWTYGWTSCCGMSSGCWRAGGCGMWTFLSRNGGSIGCARRGGRCGGRTLRRTCRAGSSRTRCGRLSSRLCLPTNSCRSCRMSSSWGCCSMNGLWRRLTRGCFRLSRLTCLTFCGGGGGFCRGFSLRCGCSFCGFCSFGTCLSHGCRTRRRRRLWRWTWRCGTGCFFLLCRICGCSTFFTFRSATGRRGT